MCGRPYVQRSDDYCDDRIVKCKIMIFIHYCSVSDWQTLITKVTVLSICIVVSGSLPRALLIRDLHLQWKLYPKTLLKCLLY